MHTAKNIVIILTLAAIGLSGTAQAAEKGKKNRMERDRVEQSDIDRESRRAERRADVNGAKKPCSQADKRVDPVRQPASLTTGYVVGKPSEHRAGG